MSGETSSMLVEALRLGRLGLSVIPARNKKPLIPWKEFQARCPTETEVRGWYRCWPEAGIAIVCGAVSDLVVVDCDPRNGDGMKALADRLPPTPTVETGGGGLHLYFRLLSGERPMKVPALLPGVDLLAEASCVIAPPSVHPSGQRYRCRPGFALAEMPLAPLPPVIRQLIALRQRPDPAPIPRRGKLARAGLTVDAVLSALNGVKRCGRGWMALCPAHEDREQSLSIADAGGKVLLHCFAGCSFSDILAALRREAA